MIIEALILKKIVDETRTPDDNFSEEVDNEFKVFIRHLLGWPIVWTLAFLKINRSRYATSAKILLAATLVITLLSFIMGLGVYVAIGFVSFIVRDIAYHYYLYKNHRYDNA